MPEPAMNGAPPPAGHKRYTIYIHYVDCLEEVDVDATSGEAALAEIKELLPTGWEPGWLKLTCEERFGLYF